jgi:hypothetical protein
MPFTRPSGFYTTSFVDDQKRNSYEMLKSFLLDTSSGRTDVLFVGERNTYFEDTTKASELVGGLADGIAKALIGSPNIASPRTLYATPIFLGSHTNAPGGAYVPSAFNWQDASNTTGVGRCLVGTRYIFDSYFYTKDPDTEEGRLPLHTNATTSTVGSLSSVFSPYFNIYSPPGDVGFSILNNASYATFAQFENSLNKTTTNVGPIAYPYFLGEPHKHILRNQPIKVAVGTLLTMPDGTRQVNNVYVDTENTLPILQNTNIAVNKRFVPFTVGMTDAAVLALDSRFSISGNQIVFAYGVDDFLIPILQYKGWSVCSAGCTGNENVYKVTNGAVTTSSETIDIWVFNRHLPYSFGGSGHEYLFTSQATSNYFDTIRGSITANVHLNGFTNLYNGETHRGLAPALHYTQVNNAGLSMGGNRAPYNWEVDNFTSGPRSTSFAKYNMATQVIANPFVWDETWDNALLNYQKNKYIELNTKLGSFYTSHVTSPNLSITTTNSTTTNSLYQTTQFAYKIKYFKLMNASPSKVFPSGTLAVNISKKTGAGAWTTIVNDNKVFTAGLVIPVPAPSRAFTETVVNLTANPADKYSLSFTGFNNPSSKLTGNHLVIHHWGENKTDQHGISFSHLYMTEDFRTGDIAYSWADTYLQLQFKEIFHTIIERQKGNPNSKRKIVVIVPCLRFENANPGDGYLGGWSQDYMTSLKNYLLQQAYQLGITTSEIVVWFIGPLFGSKVDYWSSTLDDHTVGNASINTFAKSKFVMVGTQSTNPLGGLLKANLPWQPTVEDTNNRYIPNSVYTQISELLAFDSLEASLSTTTSKIEYSLDTGEEAFLHTPSVKGFLLNGELLIQALQSNTSASYFAPPWVKTYGKYLEYTSDPVNQTPFEFLTPSTDPVDIAPYLVSFYGLVAQGNTQAKETLAYFKHKILQ